MARCRHPERGGTGQVRPIDETCPASPARSERGRPASLAPLDRSSCSLLPVRGFRYRPRAGSTISGFQRKETSMAKEGLWVLACAGLLAVAPAGAISSPADD